MTQLGELSLSLFKVTTDQAVIACTDEILVVTQLDAEVTWDDERQVAGDPIFFYVSHNYRGS
jgi:hypothetical protein